MVTAAAMGRVPASVQRPENEAAVGEGDSTEGFVPRALAAVRVDGIAILGSFGVSLPQDPTEANSAEGRYCFGVDGLVASQHLRCS
jgi:hypothetical protein